MKNLFAALTLSVALMFSVPSMAQEAPQEPQKTEEVAKAPAPQTSVGTAALEVSDALTNALTKTARSLNVEIQDFVKSPAGIVSIIFLAFHLAGDQINQWISAFVWLFCTTVPFFWWIRKTFGYRDEKNKARLRWTNDSNNSEEAPAGAIIATIFAAIIFITFAVLLP